MTVSRPSEPVLLDAVIAQKYDIVEACLKSGAKGTAFFEGNAALHIAVARNDVRMLSLLLKYTIPLYIKNTSGQTPITLAASLGFWNCVIVIANAQKEDAEKKSQYGSALLSAARANQTQAVKALLQAGTTTTWYDAGNGNRELHFAVTHRNLEMIVTLLKHGADLSIKNQAGHTPIVLASTLGFWDCVTTIAETIKENSDHKFEYGSALLNAARANQTPPIKALLRANATTTWYDTGNGNRALHFAVTHRNLEMIVLLLKHGADLSIKNEAGHLPIVLASVLRFWDCVTTIAKTTKENSDHKFEYGSALLSAARVNRSQVVKALLKANAVTTWYDTGNGNTALHFAAEHNNIAMGLELIKHGANCSTKNTAGYTPIVLAIRKQFWNFVIAFAKAKKEDKGLYAYSDALRLAAYYNQYLVAKALLEAGAATTCQTNGTLNTPLHYAAINNNPSLVAMLMIHNADPNKQNKAGKTPLMIASAKQHWDCSRAFITSKQFAIRREDIQIPREDIQKILAILFAAHTNRFHFLFRVPGDVLKIILDFAFGNLDFYDYSKAQRTYVTLRPHRFYVMDVAKFVKSYEHVGIFEKEHSEPKADAFVKTLKETAGKRVSVDKSADLCRREIATFADKQNDKDSHVMKLLVRYNLYQAKVEPKVNDSQLSLSPLYERRR